MAVVSRLRCRSTSATSLEGRTVKDHGGGQVCRSACVSLRRRVWMPARPKGAPPDPPLTAVRVSSRPAGTMWRENTCDRTSVAARGECTVRPRGPTSIGTGSARRGVIFPWQSGGCHPPGRILPASSRPPRPRAGPNGRSTTRWRIRDDRSAKRTNDARSRQRLVTCQVARSPSARWTTVGTAATSWSATKPRRTRNRRKARSAVAAHLAALV